MEVVQALKEGRALIEKGWTQGAAARYADGKKAWAIDSRHVTSYCVTGAASRVTWHTPIHEEGSPFTAVLDALAGALSDLWEVEVDGVVPWDAVDALTKWNDAPGRSKNEVLRLWTRAIELVEV